MKNSRYFSNIDAIQMKREYLGRFILATIILTLDPETILKNYKGQILVERGFWFLKDKSFRVTEVYLKARNRLRHYAWLWFSVSLFIY